MHVRLQTVAYLSALGVASAMHAAAAQTDLPATPGPTTVPSPVATENPSPLPSPTASPTLPPAATLPSNVTLTVTGSPADAAFVQAQIQAAIGRAIAPSLASGATVRYGTFVPPVVSLSPGFTTTLDVPVTVTSAVAASVQGIVAVTVANLVVPPLDPAFLVLDDDPEYVRTEGVLFRGTIDAAHPTRVYYYHANVGVQRRFVILMSPAASEPARVQLIDASAGPNPDVMSVGHAVSRSFVLLEPQNEGIVVDVGSGAPYVLRDVAIGPRDGVAGAVDVRVLNGTGLTMTIMAIAPTADPLAYLNAPRVPTDGHNRHGTFALSSIGRSVVAYTVGGPDATVEYGNRAQSPPNVDPNDPGRDAGDYGVVHRFTFDVRNPQDAPATVYLYEQPVGGVVRNSFVVNGALTDVGCARLSQRYQVGAYQVPAKANVGLDVLTMTDGGSNYPLELGVTATPPLSTTPPISAPDGCFPKASPAPQPGPSAVPSSLPQAPSPEPVPT